MNIISLFEQVPEFGH